ncbi:GNAT family N-acetyltransferase [Leuconostocaceae bacterium ESL0723]|nr:GNAT family N-acetyltransferase [Leuconostocaceae bacterium ESL0723]
MELTHEPGRYYAADDQELLAEVTYQTTNNGQTLAIDHTYVNPKLRGGGLAKQLVDTVVNQARGNHQTVLPLCSFAKMLFDRFPDLYADVTAEK